MLLCFNKELEKVTCLSGKSIWSSVGLSVDTQKPGVPPKDWYLDCKSYTRTWPKMRNDCFRQIAALVIGYGLMHSCLCSVMECLWTGTLTPT